MSLAEVLPEVQTLSRLDKIRLIQILAQELEQDEAGLIESGKSYPAWSPDRAFAAAAVLMQVLEDDMPAQEIATIKQLTRLDNEAEAIVQAAREFVRLIRLRELKAASGNVEFAAPWQELERTILAHE